MAGTNPVNPAMAALLPEGGVVCEGHYKLAERVLGAQGEKAAREVISKDAELHRILPELNSMFGMVIIPKAGTETG